MNTQSPIRLLGTEMFSPYYPTSPGLPGVAACAHLCPLARVPEAMWETRPCLDPTLRDQQPRSRAPARGLGVPRPGQEGRGQRGCPWPCHRVCREHGPSLRHPLLPLRSGRERAGGSVNVQRGLRNWLKNKVRGIKLTTLDSARDLWP